MRRTLLMRIKSETRSGAAKRVSGSNCTRRGPRRFSLVSQSSNCSTVSASEALLQSNAREGGSQKNALKIQPSNTSLEEKPRISPKSWDVLSLSVLPRGIFRSNSACTVVRGKGCQTLCWQTRTCSGCNCMRHVSAVEYAFWGSYRGRVAAREHRETCPKFRGQHRPENFGARGQMGVLSPDIENRGV